MTFFPSTRRLLVKKSTVKVGEVFSKIFLKYLERRQVFPVKADPKVTILKL